MKDGVPRTSPSSGISVGIDNKQTEPKPASIAWGGVELEMRMLDWEDDEFATRFFTRMRGPTGLMSPWAMGQLWRYQIPWATSESYMEEGRTVS